MAIIHSDFETKSIQDLTECGLDRYCKDPSTSVLLLAYAFGDGVVNLWQPHLSPTLPAKLEDAILDERNLLSAWNASFERNIFKFVLGIDIPINRCIDPMIQARYMSIPGSLEEAGEILGIKEAKFAEDGKKLIKLFSLPSKVLKKNQLFPDIPETYFKDYRTNPEEWARFTEYCKQDVRAERAALKKMRRYPLPELEYAGWTLDQEINERGIPSDLCLVPNGIQFANEIKAELKEKMIALTGLENPNSRDQMLEWVQKEGYEFGSLGKFFVNTALAGTKLSEAGRQALLLRKQASKTSAKKLDAILRTVSDDGRLRHQFSFLGSSRCGRWSGHDVQLHNLPRPNKEVEKNLDKAVEYLRTANFTAIKTEFKSEPMEVISGCIRSAFRATEGNRLVVCDLNAIENRGLGYVARCPTILEVFEKGLDPYISFAVFMYKKPYNEVTKEERQMAKPAVLGAGYRLGAGEKTQDENGDEIYTGLLGYAKNMGVEMTQEEAANAVKIFRDTYPEVKQCWYDLENAAMATTRDGEPRDVGPITFEKLGRVLMMRLPSGRYLHYINPRIEKREFFGNMKKTLIYDGFDLKSKVRVWGDVTTHGGKLIENAVQAISRDLLLNGMFLATSAGFQIVGHVHDEIITEVPNDSLLGLADLRRCMIETPKWAEGFPIDAAGWEGLYYKKA